MGKILAALLVVLSFSLFAAPAVSAFSDPSVTTEVGDGDKGKKKGKKKHKKGKKGKKSEGKKERKEEKKEDKK